MARPRTQARQWAAVQKAAARLTKEITADADIERRIKDSFHFCRQPDVGPAISALEGLAEEMSGHMSDRPWVVTASDRDLHDLQRTLVSFWVGCGGAVASSTWGKLSAKAGGPLVHFMRATLGSAVEAAEMKPPTGPAIRESIRRIKAELDDHLLESLVQVAAGEPFVAREVMDKVEELRRSGRLTVNTEPVDGSVAAQAKWPDLWAPSDPGYWPVALAWCLNSMRVTEATQLDAWLVGREKKDGRVSEVPSSGNAGRIWKITDPDWPIG